MEIKISQGKYKVYHIPGKKIGCTKNIKKRVEEEQGYKPGEYEILYETDDIKLASKAERTLQQDLGYRVDTKPYDKLFEKSMSKDINVTDQTTTFAIAADDINANFLADLSWESPYGKVKIDSIDKIDWIMDNIKKSMFNSDRSYIYNKALSEAYPFEKFKSNKTISVDSTFVKIREWADNKGIYESGDSKTQYVKLMEEAGELAQAILKNDEPEVIDAIGDMVVVLTNLAKLRGHDIEDCIDSAYNVIAKRTGKMVGGTFVKDTYTSLIEVNDPETLSAYPEPGPPPVFTSNRT
ncbi:MAG: MazG nucleotide pyrophosphohydrolase domain-containing protein [Flavobacteriales bacterium]